MDELKIKDDDFGYQTKLHKANADKKQMWWNFVLDQNALFYTCLNLGAKTSIEVAWSSGCKYVTINRKY